MIKTLPLIQASLKGFMRNWKAIFLLIVFPLILVSVVFSSFNPEGLKKIPVGVAVAAEEFEIEEFKETASYFLSITEFRELEDCIAELKQYKQYACMEILKETSYILNLYFDNTREPVIWEIVARIERVVDFIRKEKSKEMASYFITKFGSTMGRVEDFKINLIEINSKLDGYIYETDSSIIKLKNAKRDLSDALISAEGDISTVKSIKSNLKSQKNDFYSYAASDVDDINEIANSITNLTYFPNVIALNTIKSKSSGLKYQIDYYDGQADNYFVQFDDGISRYEQATKEGWGYMDEIDSNIAKLEKIKKDLVSYRSELANAENEITKIQKNFGGIEELDPELLVNPIVLRANPAYIPSLDEGFLSGFDKEDASAIEKLVRGINLLSLQTIFPKLLLLISFFLSLLISSFVCLMEINSTANKRVRLVKGIFIHEFISVYLSSLIVVFIPFFCIILLGDFLFKIQIFENFLFIIFILFLLLSIFILIGIALAYLIKKESITLLVSTFILVFMIFFSGFLLPIERMSKLSGFLASYFPGNIALSAFNKVVFYNQKLYSVYSEIIMLITCFISLIIIVLLIKKLRNA